MTEHQGFKRSWCKLRVPCRNHGILWTTD